MSYNAIGYIEDSTHYTLLVYKNSF